MGYTLRRLNTSLFEMFTTDKVFFFLSSNRIRAITTRIMEKNTRMAEPVPEHASPPKFCELSETFGATANIDRTLDGMHRAALLGASLSAGLAVSIESSRREPWGRLNSANRKLFNIELTESVYTFGKAREGVDENDGKIDLAAVGGTLKSFISHRHFTIGRALLACMRQDPPPVYIEDHSKNGTFVNSELIGRGLLYDCSGCLRLYGSSKVDNSL